jgi:hypothetical protein
MREKEIKSIDSFSASLQTLKFKGDLGGAYANSDENLSPQRHSHPDR